MSAKFLLLAMLKFIPNQFYLKELLLLDKAL